MNSINELLDLLTLKKITKTKFEGENYQTPWKRVFGGQVLAQSLHAAYQTVPEERLAHSMHGYFILAGDINLPIRYEVDILRDGGSFTTRRVVAYQANRAIFNMAASFQLIQKGVNHQINMPSVLTPDILLTDLQQIENYKDISPKMYAMVKASHPKIFEMKPVENISKKINKNSLPYSNVWFKTKESIDVDLPMQHQLLAYASDYGLLLTATLPHRKRLIKNNFFSASLDHSLWFHRSFKVDDWLLYVMDSPSASNSRGFSRGSIFDKDGVLVASVAQEGLIREVITP
ncbi:MAG: acyl-CoA thioesterase II [Flavobacteriaceae bacterium]|nr:acyl-CoA thioesterase II [Flavobacteriaceae bacterium]